MKLVVNHSELTLKGRNRPFFEKKLADNIVQTLGTATVQNTRGRSIVEIPDDTAAEMHTRLSQVFGIANYSVIHEVDSSLEELGDAVAQHLASQAFSSFAVRAKRLHKTGPTSRDIEIQLGDIIRTRLSKTVDLDHPDSTVFIEVQDKTLWYYFEKVSGPHGLPVGTGGRTLSLLSGGIDSPVSSYLMAKRGCSVDFIHFHAYANNKEALTSKIASTVEQLNRYTLNSRIIYVPYTEYQMRTLDLQTDYELVIFRRFMLRVAEAIALKDEYHALVTGDNLGQVASQTIENLAAAEHAVEIPVLRPLISYNKGEIIELAKQIGTYNLSIQDYKDCCSIIQTNPKTRANIEKIQEAENSLDMKKLIEQTIEQSEIVQLSTQ